MPTGNFVEVNRARTASGAGARLLVWRVLLPKRKFDRLASVVTQHALQARGGGVGGASENSNKKQEA